MHDIRYLKQTNTLIVLHKAIETPYPFQTGQREQQNHCYHESKFLNYNDMVTRHFRKQNCINRKAIIGLAQQHVTLHEFIKNS